VAWDANTVYDAANWAMAASHALLAAFLGYYSWHRRASRLTRFLVWPLAFFFASGIVTCVLSIFDGWPATHRLAWAMAFRAVLTLVPVAPLLWLGVRGLVLLPTKEEYDRLLREKDAALAAKDAEAARAAAADADKAFLLRRERERLKVVGAECVALKEQLTRRVRTVLTEADLMALRQQLHRINDANS
jgi:hypothetical protein